VSKPKIFSKTFLTTVGSIQVLERTLSYIKDEFDSNSGFKSDFTQYVSRINRDTLLSRPLRDDALSVLAFCRGEKDISGIEILALIYAERNMYYHNGETAKMGMGYANRQKLISKYREALLDHMLLLATYIIDEQIEKAK